MLQKIVALVLAGSVVEAATKCSEYWWWTQSYCPGWEWGDECISDDMPIKKYKCERYGGWWWGSWNYQGEVRDDRFPACGEGKCDEIMSYGPFEAATECKYCSCVEGYIAECAEGSFAHTHTQLQEVGRRRAEERDLLRERLTAAITN